MTIFGAHVPLTRTDVWRFGASLVLAVIMWGTITAANNPERTKTFSSLDVTAASLDGGLVIVGELPKVSVSLSGPRTDIIPITASDVKASINLENIRVPGNYRFNIDIAHPGSIWKKDVSPPTVMVHVDHLLTKSFPVNVQIVGNTDSTQQVGAVTPSIPDVMVSGPAGEVDQVARAVASVDIGTHTRDFTDSFTPIAVDASGKPLPNVKVSPASIPFDVRITARGKSLAVITTLNGDPATGYEVIDRTINPSTVIVDGPPDVLAKLISVSTEAIEVANATATLQKHVQLVGLPGSVKVIDPADGAVDVVVQIAERGVRQPLPGQTVNAVNIGPGLSAEISPRTVSVTVVASDATIAKLTPSDVLVQVNVAGLKVGTYSLSPIVALPSSISWVSTDPPMVTVTIRDVNSATPGPVASTPNAVATPPPT